MLSNAEVPLSKLKDKVEMCIKHHTSRRILDSFLYNGGTAVVLRYGVKSFVDKF